MDPDKMAAREKKFGKPLLSARDPKDPEAMKKRAAKFGKPVKASTNAEDEARKKVYKKQSSILVDFFDSNVLKTVAWRRCGIPDEPGCCQQIESCSRLLTTLKQLCTRYSTLMQGDNQFLNSARYTRVFWLL